MGAFEPFDIWDFHLEHVGEVVVDGRLAGREEVSHPAEGVRVSDERRGEIFHIYVLHPDDRAERVVLGRRFDADEPQLVTPRTDGDSYRLTTGLKPEAGGWSMMFGIAGPWRGPGEGWTAVGGDRANEALQAIGGTSGLLALLRGVPAGGAVNLEPARRGQRIVFAGESISAPVAFWCLSRLMPLQTRDRGPAGLLPDAS